jgi:hypothetical protein
MGFLRSLFGPSREEVWRELADQIGGQFVDGGFWRGDKVVARVGAWTITLDTFTQSSGSGTTRSSTTYTRMRAPFVNPEGFGFTIYNRSIFSPLGKLLGMQDIQVGDSFFDDQFVIKGDDQEKVRQFLAGSRLRGLILDLPRVYLTVKDDEGWFGQDFPEGVDELYFRAPGLTRDLAHLRGLFDLFAEALHQLCHIGAAYQDDPQLTL